MKRLNKIARKITAYDEIAEQFIKECEDSLRFTSKKIEQIRKGFEDDLTMDQVKVYADYIFDWKQMQQIRLGFNDGLTMEQVKVYAKPDIHPTIMRNIRLDLKDGISIEEVEEKYYL